MKPFQLREEKKVEIINMSNVQSQRIKVIIYIKLNDSLIIIEEIPLLLRASRGEEVERPPCW